MKVEECMSQSKEARKRQLQQMTREAIVAQWQKVSNKPGSGSTVSVPLLIEEILKHEYPAEGDKGTASVVRND
jgi:hypothetical protein